MKLKYSKNRIRTSLIALTLTAGLASAGELAAPVSMLPASVPVDDVISGVLSLSGNSHFISYGWDTWRDGTSMSDLEFNPSLEYTFQLPRNFSLIVGTWWAVTGKGSPADSIGGNIQEIDLWAGVGYKIDKFSITTTYQSWIYGHSTEQILDVKLAYDCFLSPSLMFHNRFDGGQAAGAEGTVMVLGLAYELEAGPVTISFPLNLGTLLGGSYYYSGADSGYAYTSLGAQASYPLAFLGDSYGDWSLNTGLTQYWTNANVGNPANNFLTYNFGISASF